MMDRDIIKKGIELDEEHISNVLSGKHEDVPFVEQIINLGFESLESFFKYKYLYLLQQKLSGNGSIMSTEVALPYLQQKLTNRQSCFVYVRNTDGTCIWAGNGEKTSELNEKFCNDNNIPIYPYNSYGGNIVSFVGDSAIGIVFPKNIGVTSGFILNRIKDILDKYFVNVIVDGNDIMVDGKKVLGSACIIYEDYILFVAHISTTDNIAEKIDFIANICGNPQTGKSIGSIDSNVLSADKLQQEVTSCLQGL